MCGRYASTRSADELTLVFDAEDGTGDAAPEADYNVAPTKPVYAVRSAVGGRRLDVLSWGLVPSWARDRRIAATLRNARAETLATTPAFRSAYARRRCLVPADGWYEWTPRPDGPGKQPYFLTPRSAGSVLAFAALWETWGTGADRLETAAIVTTAAHGALADVHDRMPLVLRPGRWAAWLGEEEPSDDLLAPTESDVIDALEIRPVGPDVGNVANNGPELVTARYPVGDAPPIPRLF
ncbi:MAG TPA: SOS response-associated peptidase [Mycobacteriales bacterium]|jgi:putative SOS response-associated peptidase YedK